MSNQQAFPSGDKAAFPSATYEPGMTLRDWFAGQAVPVLIEQVADCLNVPTDAEDAWVASKAYGLADAMLAERAKLADDCCDAGKVWNNADPTSGMWVPCEVHGGQADV